MLAKVLGVEPAEANSIKWLIFAGLFDILSLIARVIATVVAPASNREEEERKKINLLLNNGFSLDSAMAALGKNGNTMTAAQISRPHLDEIPALETGGRINNDGLCLLHKNEAVINAAGVAWLDQNYHGLIEALNGGCRADIESILNPVKSVVNDAPPVTNTPPVEAKQADAANTSPTIVMQGERVPRHLSQVAGKGRQGLIDTCKNPNCNNDYVVSVFNRVFCSTECKHATNTFAR